MLPQSSLPYRHPLFVDTQANASQSVRRAWQEQGPTFVCVRCLMESMDGHMQRRRKKGDEQNYSLIYLGFSVKVRNPLLIDCLRVWHDGARSIEPQCCVAPAYRFGKLLNAGTRCLCDDFY